MHLSVVRIIALINVFQNMKMMRLTSLIPYNSEQSENTGDI